MSHYYKTIGSFVVTILFAFLLAVSESPFTIACNSLGLVMSFVSFISCVDCPL